MDEERAGLARQHEGKDELNLAEFPLSAIADRLDPSQKTMVFEDQVWDRGRGEMVTRQLVITAAAEHGLPTALDDEVILGLVQLSKAQGFAERRVPFTRYQLIQLLGWRDEGKSYERIEKSLNRWIGVTLYYKNAWWDREHSCWVDEKFHLLDNVSLFDAERRTRCGDTQTALSISSFTWNEVVFRSFRAGNLKSLDFEFFRGLESAVSKRLFRFLDKRFFHRPRWEFHLQEFCWEHVGLARSYDSANLKRKLRPAIAELERHRFIREMPDAERFRKVSSGDWRVVFERATRGGERSPVGKARDPALCQALIQRGVTPTAASETVGRYSTEQIQRQLEVFDWLVGRKDPRVQRNPAGYLVCAIRSEYLPPREFNDRKEQEDRAARAAAIARRREARAARERLQAEERAAARQRAVDSFWTSLSPEERQRLEVECLASANPFERSLMEQGGSLAAATHQKLIEEFALRSLAGSD